MLAKANLVDEMTSNDYDTMAPSESECPTRIKSQRRNADILGEDLVSRPGCLVPEDGLLHGPTVAVARPLPAEARARASTRLVPRGSRTLDRHSTLATHQQIRFRERARPEHV
ncbi:hypothetical protein LSAT2_012940 [Lamellibrachia satsuma]|nr:hypothetical protein LSAT2_012940 [Lamellibrachia satsuma]